VLTRHLDYPLPEGAVATHPAEPRDSARLMVVRVAELIADPECRPAHHRVRGLPDLLEPTDRLVVNDTRVVPARFVGVNTRTGGRVEGLWLRDLDPADNSGQPAGETRWACLIKARRHRPGFVIRLLAPTGEPSPVTLTIVGPAEEGVWEVRVGAPAGFRGSLSGPAVLATLGLTPLPPYIQSARKARAEGAHDAEDRDRYQTVYAAADEACARSVAAPTAGLHFTSGLLAALEGQAKETAVAE